VLQSCGSNIFDHNRSTVVNRTHVYITNNMSTLLLGPFGPPPTKQVYSHSVILDSNIGVYASIHSHQYRSIQQIRYMRYTQKNIPLHTRLTDEQYWWKTITWLDSHSILDNNGQHYTTKFPS